MEEQFYKVPESSLNEITLNLHRFIAVDKTVFNPQNAQAALFAIDIFDAWFRNPQVIPERYPAFNKFIQRLSKPQ